MPSGSTPAQRQRRRHRQSQRPPAVKANSDASGIRGSVLTAPGQAATVSAMVTRPAVP